VSNTGKGYLVEGKLKAKAVAVCDRCLAPFTVHIVGSIQEEFLPAGAKPVRSDAGEEHPSGEEAGFFDDLNVFEGDAFSLDELVHDHLLLGLPQKLLCRPDCRGMCPRCGANLNAGECGCPADDVDPRLAPLMDLLKRED